MSSWKPGDVAMVECSDGRWRQGTCHENLYVVDGSLRWVFPDNTFRQVTSSQAQALAVVNPQLGRDQEPEEVGGLR